jgi:hypothetical protein
MNGSQSGWRWIGAAELAVVAGLLVASPQGWPATWRVRNAPGITSPEIAPWVGEVVRCFERLKITDFRVAGRLRTERDLQPLVVAAWPVEVSNRSPVVVVSTADLSTLPCHVEILCPGQEAAVAACAP